MPSPKHRALEILARGPHPLLRMPRPMAGERCHRCHRYAPNNFGCALCNPERLAERGLPTNGAPP